MIFPFDLEGEAKYTPGLSLRRAFKSDADRILVFVFCGLTDSFYVGQVAGPAHGELGRYEILPRNEPSPQISALIDNAFDAPPPCGVEIHSPNGRENVNSNGISSETEETVRVGEILDPCSS